MVMMRRYALSVGDSGAVWLSITVPVRLGVTVASIAQRVRRPVNVDAKGRYMPVLETVMSTVKRR